MSHARNLLTNNKILTFFVPHLVKGAPHLLVTLRHGKAQYYYKINKQKQCIKPTAI